MHTPILLPVVYLCVYGVSIAGTDVTGSWLDRAMETALLALNNPGGDGEYRSQADRGVCTGVGVEGGHPRMGATNSRMSPSATKALDCINTGHE